MEDRIAVLEDQVHLLREALDCALDAIKSESNKEWWVEAATRKLYGKAWREG